MSRWVAIAFVLLIAWGVFRVETLIWEVRTLSHEVHALTREAPVGSEVGKLYMDWYSAGSPPVHREVTTYFQDSEHPNETQAEWRARHLAALAARMDQYPPV